MLISVSYSQQPVLALVQHWYKSQTGRKKLARLCSDWAHAFDLQKYKMEIRPSGVTANGGEADGVTASAVIH